MSPSLLAHPAATSTGERSGASSRSHRQLPWEATALQVLPPLNAVTACARGSHRYCGRAPLLRTAAVAFIGWCPSLVRGRTTAAYARLLPVRGRRLSAASARRLPLPPSRSLLLACSCRSAVVLSQSDFCSRTAVVRGYCLRTAAAGSTAAAVVQQCC
ncbi:hypothetical protein B296_00023270 [Ensete ventricosum]|uniref:Uncharacterized protein n=1 Tax=Ensete ventricosum TaxID=4639 RepID=A0A426ZN68_ENSVE|nr:hypothetical protein B296_00023270 [Ensete ventricosum]